MRADNALPSHCCCVVWRGDATLQHCRSEPCQAALLAAWHTTLLCVSKLDVSMLPASQVWDGGGPRTAVIVKKSGSARTSAALRKIGAW
jgi:hypothetical protein